VAVAAAVTALLQVGLVDLAAVRGGWAAQVQARSCKGTQVVLA
jgi:hypothetical protein